MRLILVLLLNGFYLLPSISQATSEAVSSINDCKPNEVVKFRGATARLDNDLFTGTDRNYTNGVSLTLISHDIQGKLRPECLPVSI